MRNERCITFSSFLTEQIYFIYIGFKKICEANIIRKNIEILVGDKKLYLIIFF